MRFKVEIPWPYGKASVEARRLIEAGGGTITDQNVFDEVLEQLPEDSDAAFVVAGKPGTTRELSVGQVRELREAVGFAFWTEG